MKGFWKEFAEKLGVDIDGRSYWVIGDGAVIVEGHGGVKSVREGEISFIYGDGLLNVVGSDLKIKNASRGFAAVVGKISGVDKV